MIEVIKIAQIPQNWTDETTLKTLICLTTVFVSSGQKPWRESNISQEALFELLGGDGTCFWLNFFAFLFYL